MNFVLKTNIFNFWDVSRKTKVNHLKKHWFDITTVPPRTVTIRNLIANGAEKEHCIVEKGKQCGVLLLVITHWQLGS
jgi:hypothetical protein